MLRSIARVPEIDLTVFFLSGCSLDEYHDPGFKIPVRWDVPLLDGYHHQFLAADRRAGLLPSFWRPLIRGLGRRFRSGHFEALWVHGYGHEASLRAILVAKSLGMKVLFRGESHLKGSPRSRLRVIAKAVLLPRLFKAIDALLAIGTLNREYYLHHGVPERRIFMMPYAVDNAFFQARVAEARPDRERLRAELGLEAGRPIILYASKFERRKRAGDLLDAYLRLTERGTREPVPYLLFVGDGDERPKLEARVNRLGRSGVKFVGFKGQRELPRYYDLCDVFVLPAEHEPWGLVVNEVMNAGKPVIISDQVGAGPDLVVDGENGFVVPVGDVAILQDRLRSVMTDSELAHRMGKEGLRRIRQWDFEADVKGLLEALASVVTPPVPYAPNRQLVP